MSADFLKRMCLASAERALRGKRERPLAPLAPGTAPPPHRLVAALAAPHGGLGLIAEVKRASPSKGAIDLSLDAAAQARIYEAAGADAVSVLTEPDAFQGSLDDLSAAVAACRLPVLRKDFIVDEYQLLEAQHAGAAAVLLIAAALDQARLTHLFGAATELGLDVLVETHDAQEVERALALGCPLIGINNRDLRTLNVDLAVTESLAPLVGDAALVVSESGVGGAADARRVARAGAAAILVGEALVRAGDLADVRARVRALVSATSRPAPAGHDAG